MCLILAGCSIETSRRNRSNSLESGSLSNENRDGAGETDRRHRGHDSTPPVSQAGSQTAFDWPMATKQDLAPPPSGVTDPFAPTPGNAGASQRQALAEAYEIRIDGKDADRSEFLDVLAYALSRYPAGSMRGLRITLNEQDLDVTGGVGGFWTRRGPALTIFQPDATHLHVSLHELAHNFDQWTHRGEITRSLIRAASENGEVQEQNIPSSYARSGLSNPDLNMARR
jgi:hypothetical protein